MTRLLLTMLLVSSFLANESQALAQESVQNWTSLFNGKDLSGWKTDPKQPKSWRVKDGVIVSEGNAPSHLFSERADFDSFHLRVEAKINATGNSGVYFRCEPALLGAAYPVGYEAQINSGNGKDDQLTGSLRGFVPVHEHLVKSDQWFMLDVTGDGRFITIKVDGKTAARYKDEKNTYRKGHFALQHMGGTSVAFRRIDVLEPASAPVAMLASEPDGTVPLLLYYHSGRLDNATLSTKVSKKSAEDAGYRFARVEGRILKEAREGTVPLLLYWSENRKEYLTVSTEVGKKSAQDAGYALVGVQGHVYKEPRRGTIPLYLYWSADRADNCTFSTKVGKDSVEGVGYSLSFIEGYVYDAWKDRPKPWAVVLCKFNDNADFEPRPPSYYREAFTEAGAGKGREFEYFRQVSHGHIDMTGTKIFGWYTLPNHSTKELEPSPDRHILHEWALEVARADGVDPALFYGIMVIFNHSTDIGSFGFSPSAVLSDAGGDWNTNLYCHELGHGFGLDHARSARPAFEYGDLTSVMGGGSMFAGKFGNTGPGLNAPNLRHMGFLSPDRIWTAHDQPGSQTVTLAALNHPGDDGYFMATIPPDPAGKSKISYIVEFRRKMGWDQAFPRDTLVIHEDRGDTYSYLLTRNNKLDFDSMQVVPGHDFKIPKRNLTIRAASFDARHSTAKVTITIEKPRNPPPPRRPEEREYMIVNVQSGRVLDADLAGITDEGTKLSLTGKDAKDHPNRRWNFAYAGEYDGKWTVTIVNVQNGHALDADLGSIDADGTKVALLGMDAKDAPNRAWRLVDAGNGMITIVNAKSGRLLDADLATIDGDGTKVALFGKDTNGMDNRKWRIVEVED